MHLGKLGPWFNLQKDASNPMRPEETCGRMSHEHPVDGVVMRTPVKAGSNHRRAHPVVLQRKLTWCSQATGWYDRLGNLQDRCSPCHLL